MKLYFFKVEIINELKNFFNLSENCIHFLFNLFQDRKSADAASFCQDVTKETIDLPSHKVSIIETDIFDPSLNLYLGENKDEEDEDEVDTNEAEETNDTADKKIYIK